MWRRCGLAAAAAALPCCLASAAPAPPPNGVTVTGQQPGPSAFIETLALSLTGQATLTSAQFTIAPKTGSLTRPISATYSAAYMIARGYWDGSSPTLAIPVFGLYANATNDVALNFTFSDGSATQVGTQVQTAAYDSGCGDLDTPNVVVQARTSTSALSYDYVMLKKHCDPASPTIIDTDGNIRWVSTDMTETPAVMLFQNQFYASKGNGVDLMQFDGTYATLADYAGIGVTYTGHHNFDPGRTGIVMDVDTKTQTESVDVEIDAAGNVLNVWDLGAIITKAMIAGGDDPTQFVQPVGTDWFHNNSTTYNPADNTLIVSSRENFVIALDYDTHAIKWIFGDSAKHWHQFKSLRKFEMHPAPGTLEPEGQHAVSIADNGDLLLFDDGQKSAFQDPPGRVRSYSTPRAYHIDTSTMTATATYSYAQHQTVYSDICSSVYEDPGAQGNYLIDYSVAQGRRVTEIVGVGASGQKVFDYRYPAVDLCDTAWNAQIVHLENLQF